MELYIENALFYFVTTVKSMISEKPLPTKSFSFSKKFENFSGYNCQFGRKVKTV